MPVDPKATPVAGATEAAKKPRKARVDMKTVVFAAFVGGQKAFLKTQDEVVAFITALPANKQGKVSVFKQVPLKVQTQVTI